MKFRRTLVRLVPLAVFAVGAVAFYLHDTTPEAPVVADSGLNHPGTAALRAAIDPETGALVTGPAALGTNKAQDAELAQMLSRSDEGLKAVQHADGHVSVNLQGRFMSASVAHLDADGSVKTLCTENETEAREFLAGAAQTDSHGLEVQ